MNVVSLCILVNAQGMTTQLQHGVSPPNKDMSIKILLGPQ
jgi:hypothetical protein